MAECLNCGRVIRRGRFCSAIVCATRGEKQAAADEKALLHNGRYWAAKERREAANDDDLPTAA